MARKVCRTCLKLIENQSEEFSIESSQFDNIKLKQKLQACVPEIVLHRVKNAVICSTCTEALNAAYTFKMQCAETESQLSEYLLKKKAKYANLNNFLIEKNNDDVVVIDSPQAADVAVPNCLFPNNSIKCTVCQKGFKTVEEIQKHVHTHSDNLKCTSCKFQANSKQALNEHLKTHKAEATFRCPDCDFTTNTKNDFIVHCSKHTGGKYFSCNLCSYKALKEYNVRRHLRRHHGQKLYKCNVCSFVATDDAALCEHVKTHSGPAPFSCTDCSYVTNKQAYLRKHIKRHHSGKTKNKTQNNPASEKINPFQISMSDIQSILEGKNVEKITQVEDNRAVESFTVTVADIEQIIQSSVTAPDQTSKNNKKKIFRCSKCRLPFKFQYLLKKHMSTHAKDNKVLKCKECGHTDTCKNSFDVHMKLHTGGKIYACDKCEYRTVHLSSIMKHNRVHTKGKPLQCSHCNYKTVKKVNYEKHLLTHTPKETILNCNECPYKTSSTNNMEVHREMHVIGNEFIDNSIHSYIDNSIHDFLPRTY